MTEVGFTQALDLEGGLGARRMSVPVKDVSPKDSHYLVVVYMLSHDSSFVTPWTVACQAPSVRGISRILHRQQLFQRETKRQETGIKAVSRW